MSLILVFRGGLCVNSRHLRVCTRKDALNLQRRRTNASICRPIQCSSNRHKFKYHLRGPSDLPSRPRHRLGVARASLAASEGTEKMREIAEAVQEGAAAYLARQFRTLSYLLESFSFFSSHFPPTQCQFALGARSSS